MYDWQRREETKNLLRHDTNDKIRNEKNIGLSKQQQTTNGNGLTPSKSKQNYPQHHLNISSNIFNNENSSRIEDISAEKKIRPRSNRTYDHSPIFGGERTKTEQTEDTSTRKENKASIIRNTNTYTSQIFKKDLNKEDSQQVLEKQKNDTKFKNRNASNQSQITLSHKENNDSHTHKVFQSKKRVDQIDNNIFKPLTPRSAQANKYKIRDHTTAELFGDEPQQCLKRPQPQPFEPLYSLPDQSPTEKKLIQFYASRDQNGDMIPNTSRVERCHTSHETRENNGNFTTRNQKGINGITSEATIRHLTPQMKKQMHILGSFSEYKDTSLINKNKQETDKFKNEIRSYNDKWWNKIEKAKNSVECFLSNKQIVETQKMNQLKSDFFEEVQNQIFGVVKDINDPNSITADEIGVRPVVPQPNKKQQKWQFDPTNEDKRRKDQQYSDLFGYGDSKVLPKNPKDDALFPANFQSNRYDSIKFKTDFPSANIEYGTRPEQGLGQNNQNSEGQEVTLKANMNQASDQRYYANLSSCLDSNGYRNNFSKNNAWKEEKNLKFDKYKINEKSEDQHNVSINFGCTKNDEGKNQRIVEIDFKNFSDKFDEQEFKRYCSRKGIHLVDFQYDFNKLNNKIAGNGQVKIRDIHQDTNRIENVKDHLRQQGLVIKNTRITLSTNSINYNSGTHLPHKSSIAQQIESPSSQFNPNITPQQSLQLQGKTNKKNVESKGFKLLVTKKKKQSIENEGKQNLNNGNAQSAKKLYDTARSEIDTAKKVVENHNWKRAIDGVQKESKRNQEIRAKSALVNRKTVTIAE